MEVKNTKIQGVKLFSLKKFSDPRGFFLEIYHNKKYNNLNINDQFVQENHSRSKGKILRGLHYTIKKPQSQILTVINGKIFDVVVDLRHDSSTFGEWESFELDSNKEQFQIYMPPGIAHGFCVLSEFADLHYKVSEFYNKNDEGGLIWNDPSINIHWPIKNPIVSLRDSSFPCLSNISKDKLPQV